MNEERLRQVVHDVVARHLGQASLRTARGAPPPLAHAPAFADSLSSRGPQALPVHISHSRYLLIKVDDACVIEPSVGCNHCGYCESHGH